MRPRFWDIEADSRFDRSKHYEFDVYDSEGNCIKEARLTEEGSKLALLIVQEKFKSWDNEVSWMPWYAQGKYIIAVAPDKVRHAMERVETRPTLFVAWYRSLCDTLHKEYDWTLMTQTYKNTVYQTGAVNCDYCLGILTFSED